MQLPIDSRRNSTMLAPTPNKLSAHWPEDGKKLAIKNTFYTVESDDEDDVRAGSKSCLARMAQDSASSCCPEDGSQQASESASNTSMSDKLPSPRGLKLTVKNTFWLVEDEDDEDETWIGTKSCFARMSQSTSSFWLEDECSPAHKSPGLASTVASSTGVTSSCLASSSLASSCDTNEWANTHRSDVEPGANASEPISPSTDNPLMVPVVSVYAPRSFGIPSAPVLPVPPPPVLPMAETSPTQDAASPQSRMPQPSIGSAGHGTVGENGEPGCQPCAWFWRPNSCVFNGECKFCHLCPESELKKRKKEKVMRLRKLEQEEKERATAMQPQVLQ